MINNKSLLKIYEVLLSNLDKRIIIEDLISNARVGRSAGFNSIKLLSEIGIVNYHIKGRQKEISLVRDRYSLGFKIFLDSFRFKQLDGDLKFAVGVFVEYVKDISSIKSLLVFGSCIVKKDYNDIDLLCVHDKNLDQKMLLNIRNKVESVLNKTINLHFSEDIYEDRFANSLCVFGFDYCINFMIGKSLSKQSYIEALDWFDSYEKNKANFDNVFINLAFAYSISHELSANTKEDAKILLSKRYNITKHNIKGIMKKIGKEIFR